MKKLLSALVMAGFLAGLGCGGDTTAKDKDKKTGTTGTGTTGKEKDKDTKPGKDQ